MSFLKHSNIETIGQGVDNWDAPMNENLAIIDKGLTFRGVAGLTISKNEVVYVDSSGLVQLALAGVTVSQASSVFSGMANDDYNKDASVYTQYDGWVQDYGWSWTPGDKLYLSSSTPGLISTTQPTDRQLVAVAISTNEITLKPHTDPSPSSVSFSNQQLAKAWASFDGTGTPAYNDSFNFSGTITDGGVGIWTLTIDTDFANANYAAVITGGFDTAVQRVLMTYSSKAAGSIIIKGVDSNQSNPLDVADVSVILIGDQ